MTLTPHQQTLIRHLLTGKLECDPALSTPMDDVSATRNACAAAVREYFLACNQMYALATMMNQTPLTSPQKSGNES